MLVESVGSSERDLAVSWDASRTVAITVVEGRRSKSVTIALPMPG